MPAIDLTIEQLLLDSSNPRIGKAANQREALQKVLDDQKDKLAELAESVLSEGMSPIDRLLVLREKQGGEQFITLEGNRRVAALRILLNPAVLSSLTVKETLKKRFERLSNGFDRHTIEPIACFEVETREEGTQWIYLRHTGENEGRGVVNWSGLAAARFRGSDPALQALEFVKSHGNLQDHEKHMLEDSFPITTLDRLLSTKEVRDLIGVEVKDRKLRTKLDANELIKPLRRMVLDLANKKVNVSGLKNRTKQVEYVKSFGKDMPSLSKAGSMRAIETISAKESKILTSPVKRRAQDPSERKTLVPRNVRLNISHAKVADIFKELRDLKLEDHPHASSVLLRVFLELSVDHYMDKNKLEILYKDKKGNKWDKKLREKVEEVIGDLVTHHNCNKRDFASVSRALNDKNSPLNIDLLNSYLHNLFVTPKTRDLRSAWDDAQRFFERIWQ